MNEATVLEPATSPRMSPSAASVRNVRRLTTCLLALALLAGACSSDDEPESVSAGLPSISDNDVGENLDDPGTARLAAPGTGIGNFEGTLATTAEYVRHEFRVEKGHRYSATAADGTDEERACDHTLYVGVAGPESYFDNDRSFQSDFPDDDFLSDFDSAVDNDSDWIWESVDGGRPADFDLVVGEAQCANQPIDFVAEDDVVMEYIITVYQAETSNWVLDIEDLGPA